MAKPTPKVKCFDRTTKTGRKYTTCKSTRTGKQLRKPATTTRTASTKVKRTAKKLAPLIRRRPPPPPPPPSRSVQMNMLRRGINPDAPIFM